MIVWLASGTLLGVLLGVSAAAVEPLLRARGRAVRWLWAAAAAAVVAGAVVAPLARGLGAHAARAASGAVGGAADPAFSVAAGRLAAASGPGHDLRRHVLAAAFHLERRLERFRESAARWDRPVIVLWAVLSTALLLSLIRAGMRVALLMRTGRRRRIGGVRLVTDAARGPAAAGVLGPWVVLPAWLRQLRPAERRLMVAHEVEHVRAGDPLLKLAGVAAVLLMPWNAAAWWILRRLQLAIELDCDARVLRRYGDAHAYAAFLLAVAGRRRTVPALVLAIVDRRRHLERRLLAMTERSTALPRRWSARLALALAAAGIAAVLDPPLPHALARPAATTVADAAAADAPGTAVQDGTITGTVIHPDGTPAQGVQVLLPALRRGAVTSAEGRFLLVRVPAATHALTVSAPGYPPAQVEEVSVIAGHTSALVITLAASGAPAVAPARLPPVPAPAATSSPAVGSASPEASNRARDSGQRAAAVGTGAIAGTIVDRSGVPVGGARVGIADTRIAASSNQSGRFLLLGVSPGDATLRIAAPGYAERPVYVEGVAGGETVTLVIVLEPAGG